MAQAGSRSAGAQSTPPAEQTKTEPTTPATSADAHVRELEAENARLREQLATAEKLLERAGSKEPTPAKPGKPTEPSFGLSEGQRAELEATGRTVSPFTGKRQVGSGKPGEQPREASADEFAKAKPAGK